MFTSIFESDAISITEGLWCSLTSLGLGLLIALIYSLKNNYTKSFIISVILLPLLVQAVIMMVNGNLGAGIAVFGAFSLIRFRSAQGNAKQIMIVFLAMAVGLATGMGQLLFALLFTVIACVALLVVSFIPLGEERSTKHRTLKITIPENLNYYKAFEKVFQTFTNQATIEKVKTTNMGSMYEITYHVLLKNNNSEKVFLDELRCLNGNLPILCGTYHTVQEEL